MSLHYIAKMLGGETFRGGAQANVPAPGHKRADRSVSLGLNAAGRVIINCYGTNNPTGWKVVRDDLRARGLIDDDGKPSFGGGQARYFDPPPSDPHRIARARELWDLARPIGGTLSQHYAASRGIVTPIGHDVARHLTETPISCFDRNITRTMPAFLVAIRNPAAELTAVEITYLSPGGRRTSRLKLSRKTIGVMEPSSAVRVDPVGPELLVAEGFWTTLSARQRVGVPAWSLTCTRNMRSFVPPDEVQVLHIARDNGADGTNAADTLAHRARGLGKTVIGHAPLARFDDFNSWHMAHLGLTG